MANDVTDEPLLFELMQNADIKDVREASVEIAKMLADREHDAYPALLGVMLKTVAQFLSADPTIREGMCGHTAIIAVDEDTFAKIDFEFVTKDELIAPCSEAIH